MHLSSVSKFNCAHNYLLSSNLEKTCIMSVLRTNTTN